MHVLTKRIDIELAADLASLITSAKLSHFSNSVWLFLLDPFKLHNSIQVRAKKIVPNIKGDIGMEVYYLCQPNTYVIAREFSEQQ